MNDVVKQILMLLAAFLLGNGGLKLFDIAQKRWEIRYGRKAEKEDQDVAQDDKIDKLERIFSDYVQEQKQFNTQILERFKELEKHDEASRRALKFVLLDRIVYIGHSYIKHGEVSFDERRRLREMHDTYHNDLGGNGDADNVMNAVDELPLSK